MYPISHTLIDGLILSGSEGSPAYKNYLYHLRASVVGTALSIAAGLVMGWIIWLV